MPLPSTFEYYFLNPIDSKVLKKLKNETDFREEARNMQNLMQNRLNELTKNKPIHKVKQKYKQFFNIL